MLSCKSQTLERIECRGDELPGMFKMREIFFFLNYNFEKRREHFNIPNLIEKCMQIEPSYCRSIELKLLDYKPLMSG